MQLLRNLLDEGNWCSLLFVAVVMAHIGDAMVQGHPNMRLWGGRIAVATFLLFSITRAVEVGEPVTADLVAAVLQGLIAAAIVVGPAWISIACAAFASDQYANVRNRLRNRLKRVRGVRHDRQEDDERTRQEREQAARETFARRRTGDDRKRRRDARAKALRAFHLLRADLGDRFTDKEFTEYVKAYLADDQTPEDVEHHTTKLIQLLKLLSEETGTGVHSCGALNQRFEQQKAAIAAASVDDDLRKMLITELEEQYEEDFRRLIREQRQ